MVTKKEYNFSFTGASALMAETLVIAEQYFLLKDWDKAKEVVQESNLLNKIKESTLKRKFQEIKKRLELLTPDQLSILISGSTDDAKAIILLSLVKVYPFFKEFIVEIVRSKYLLFDNSLTEIDYDRFVNTKSLSHPELNNISGVTAKKVKQVVFKMLEQVGLITSVKEGIIQKPMLSNNVVKAIIKDDPSLLSSFFYSSDDIKALIVKMEHE